MDEISQALNSALSDLAKVLKGLEQGVNMAIVSTPRLFQQEIDMYAEKVLDLTSEEYQNATDVYWESGAIVVEIDEDNWLANALESGVDGWDMKETHLNSPKAKFSREGFKYLTIPIQKHPTSRGGGTAKSQYYHQLVNQALQNPTFGTPKVKVGLDGTIGTMEGLQTNEPNLGGFYRVRRFKGQDELDKNIPSSTQYIMFRTMSNHPRQKDKWIHPGIRGIHGLEHLELWSRTMYPQMIENMLEHYIDSNFDA